MAKRYMGEGDPVLDALYEELNATGRKNRTDRRKRRQLERQIRDIRAGRLGGLRGGLRGFFDNLSLRKYPVPASATAAASTLGLGEVIGEVIGEAKRKRIRVPSTVAEVAPEIEEIEVTAEKRPEIEEDQWVYLDPMKLSSRIRAGVHGKYSGDLEKQFGNFSKEYSPFSKKNQRYNPETREREFRAPPDYMEKKEWINAMPTQYAHGGILSGQADRLSRAGRGDDTMLMHVTPDEVAGLASLAPGMMTINPETGLPEAGWFRNLLGTAAPFLMSMIPGIGPVLGGAMGGGLGSLIKGGDWKDAILGAGLGALGGKMFGGAASETGAGVLADETTAQALTNPEAFQGAIKFAPEPFVEAGITPELMSGKIVPAIQSGVNPTLALSQAGVNPEQLGVLKGSLSGLAKDALPDTLSQNIKNIRAGGLGGIKDALMSGSGLVYIGGTGLQLQHEGQEAHEDFLLAKEEADRQRERDIAAYYSENLPYLAREGGSIYKNRYINGNWS